MASDNELDKVLSNGLTRRQILEKVMSRPPGSGLRGDAKWQSMKETMEWLRRKRQDESQQPTS